MVLAIVREAGQIVLNDNEKLDTWSVVLNGTVELRNDQLCTCIPSFISLMSLFCADIIIVIRLL
ncbi:hypothetical protein KSF78_0008878 [Schistosoma japonicum]|nr:hypothetical protein KSF78_0008878 [Schistosoma japonicum]